MYAKFRGLREIIDMEDTYISFTIVDTSPKDLRDILYYLIMTYKPAFNNAEAFRDSGRYRNIYVKETQRDEFDVVEKLR